MGKRFLLFVLVVVSLISVFFISILEMRKEKSIKTVKGSMVNVVIYLKSPTVREIIPINCKDVVPVVYSHVTLLGKLSLKDRKRTFTEVLLPEILIANCEVLKERKFLLKVLNRQNLSEENMVKLQKLEKKYRTDNLKELLNRINTVPVSLALAQGAIESGWGTSRFFVDGNNVFGMYTFHFTNKNLKAKRGNVYLKAYDNILQSVEDYIYNINVGWAYQEFREKRERGADINSLIHALIDYSTERDNYVRLLANAIRENHLSIYDNCSLCPSCRR